MQVEFSKTIQRIADETGKEIAADLIWSTFKSEYLDRDAPIRFVDHKSWPDTAAAGLRAVEADIVDRGKARKIAGKGNGPIAAFVHALGTGLGVELDVVDYHEHALGRGSDATAVAYVETVADDATARWGIGTDPNIITASLRAVLSAVMFNALIIVALIPLAIRGVAYRPIGAAALLRRNLLRYGVGGIVAPFIFIKLIDLGLVALGLV